MSEGVPTGPDLLGKADALMRRHRVFVARSADQPMPPSPDAVVPPLPVLPAVAEEPLDDDLPVLTDVVPVDELIRAMAAQPTLVARADVAQQIQRWLDETLPETVLQVMDGMTDRLVAALTERARAELIERLMQTPDSEASET